MDLQALNGTAVGMRCEGLYDVIIQSRLLFHSLTSPWHPPLRHGPLDIPLHDNAKYIVTHSRWQWFSPEIALPPDAELLIADDASAGANLPDGVTGPPSWCFCVYYYDVNQQCILFGYFAGTLNSGPPNFDDITCAANSNDAEIYGLH